MGRFSVPLAAAKEGNAFIFGDVRISVISDRIVRVEKGAFTDLRTQTIYCRNFSNPQFSMLKAGDKPVVATKCAQFSIDLKTLDIKVDRRRPRRFAFKQGKFGRHGAHA